MMTEGGPAYTNYTVAVYSFIQMWKDYELGYPAAIAVMLSAVLLVVSAIYVRFIERSRNWM
jgi:multiple sugar transport system permease protein